MADATHGKPVPIGDKTRGTPGRQQCPGPVWGVTSASGRGQAMP